MITDVFEIVAGSVAGRDHVIAGRNNQDAYCWSNNIEDDFIVAVVCDGCSDGEHHEVGAKIGARLLNEIISRNICELYDTNYSLGKDTVYLFWDNVRADMLAELRILADKMSRDIYLVVKNYLLFTAVGAIITPWGSCIFSLGDGLYALNGKVTNLGPFAGNAPPYLAYGLIHTSLSETNPELLKFQIHEIIPTQEVKSVLIGTDGVADFIGAEQKKMPGKNQLVGPISQFWTEDKYFKNTDMIRRKLFLVNREIVKPDWGNKIMLREEGLLPDDTTLVCIRRKPSEKE